MDSVNRPRELLISDCGRTLVAFVAKIIMRGAHRRPSLPSPHALSHLSLPFDLLNLPIYISTYLLHHLDLLRRHDLRDNCIIAFSELFLLQKMCFKDFQIYKTHLAKNFWNQHAKESKIL